VPSPLPKNAMEWLSGFGNDEIEDANLAPIRRPLNLLGKRRFNRMIVGSWGGAVPVFPKKKRGR